MSDSFARLQGRLPKELALKGSEEIEEANRHLNEIVILLFIAKNLPLKLWTESQLIVCGQMIK